MKSSRGIQRHQPVSGGTGSSVGEVYNGGMLFRELIHYLYVLICFLAMSSLNKSILKIKLKNYLFERLSDRGKDLSPTGPPPSKWLSG